MNTILKRGLLLLTVTALLMSCKKSEAHEEESSDAIMTADTISSAAAVEQEGSTRKFIRTADIKFKVKNTAQSTYTIENITNKFGGFVTYTNLQSTIIDEFETKISLDSTLQTIRYKVENDITIRVPNKRLDTIIKLIAKQIEFLDYRIIKADDVSLRMLSNQLSQSRSASTEKRITKAIDTKGKKINDIIEAENTLANKKEQIDNAKLENLSIQDQINFSTLTLKIYQNVAVKQEITASAKDADYYRPNIGIRILDSLVSGWNVLLAVIVFLFEIWWLLLAIILGYFLYKRQFKKE